jgi:hypothetical protein
MPENRSGFTTRMATESQPASASFACVAVSMLLIQHDEENWQKYQSNLRILFTLHPTLPEKHHFEKTPGESVQPVAGDCRLAHLCPDFWPTE